MPTTKTVVLRALLFLTALGSCVVACQGPEAFYRPGGGSGGTFGTGGAGPLGSGGATGTGGIVVIGTGGTPATGGTPGTGGRATGGSPGTGGTPATGGITGTGGRGTGGTPATGGITGTGGLPATGGITGTGGLPATGGVTGTGGKGTGGSPATGGTTGTGGSAPTGAVVVDTYCQSATSAQSIGLYVDLENTTSAAIPLSQITFRYYFQLGETNDPPHLDIDYAVTVPTGDITAKYVAISPAVTGANEYMEVGFTTAAGSVAAQSDTGQYPAPLARDELLQHVRHHAGDGLSVPHLHGRENGEHRSVRSTDDHHRVRERRPGRQVRQPN